MLEYEFETVQCDYGAGYSLFGGVGLETDGHRETILMNQQQIDRINALARKAKAEGLTEEEKAEQAILRRAYIDSVVGNLKGQLDNTVVVDEKGRRRKLREKKEGE